MASYTGGTDATDFPPGARWLNVNRPLALRDFWGKLLVLDFWTYGRTGCLHVLQVLRKLHEKYPEELAVVGVHTAKFDHEGSTENIRLAIMRYGVLHPVVNDASARLWQAYAVRAWPTLVFIGPEGRVIGRVGGELTYEQGAHLVDGMLAEFRRAGSLRPSLSPGDVERPPATLLNFPAAVLVDSHDERLFIADSGHHRVLVADLDGVVQTIVGSGTPGLADGVLEGARFNRPQGMALSGDTLYVADTGNHAIRLVDLEAGIVETLAGTGRRGVGHVEGGPAWEVDLRSPWDLALAGRGLHVAMAGSHQIWTLNLDTRIMQASVGTGAEDLRDGPPHEALLAQPSGIAADEDGVLYCADSETSAIRFADLTSAHHVGTLVGRGLFEFGDVDGGGPDARLQHPLGVDVEAGVLYVADTYNNKIKVIDIDTRRVGTLAGTGRAAREDGALGQSAFHEPGGVSIADGRLYVADTNNHAIRVIDLAARTVRTLNVDF